LEKLDECLAAKRMAMESSKQRNNPPDDIKSARGDIYNSIKKILGLTQCGNNSDAFLRDTIAPLIKADTNVYKELEREIFGDDPQ